MDPVTDDRIEPPGASSDSHAALLLKLETVIGAVFDVEPTLTAVEMQPGELIDDVKPSLPEAMTTATPSDRRLSMAALRPLLMLALSQVTWLVY